MREDWDLKTIADTTKIVAGGTPKTKIKEYWGGNVAWITPADLGKLTTREVNLTRRTITSDGLQKSSAKLFPANSVILSSRAPIGHLAINTIPMATNQGCRGIVPNKNLDTIFLYYFLKSNVKLLNELGTGTTFKELSTKNLGFVKIPIPPLEEQKQIVAILDEAFKAIDQAKANIEKNIKNAKELFQSKREELFKFAYTRGNKESEILKNLCTIKTGKLNANAMVENGKYPFFTCSREVFSIDTYAFDTEAVLLAGNNASGDFNVKLHKGKFNAYQRTYVIIINDQKVLNYSFLKHKLEHNLQAFKRQSVGANTRFLKIGMINNLEIPLPPVNIQIELCKNLDSIADELSALVSYYEKKSTSIEELKKSILQKAFAGELTNKTVGV